MVQNCRFLCKKILFELKPLFVTTVFCLKLKEYFGSCTTYQATTPDQLTIPLNELPCFYASERNGKHIEPSVPFYV